LFGNVQIVFCIRSSVTFAAATAKFI
jgi:hypothetical protein